MFVFFWFCILCLWACGADASSVDRRVVMPAPKLWGFMQAPTITCDGALPTVMMALNEHSASVLHGQVVKQARPSYTGFYGTTVKCADSAHLESGSFPLYDGAFKINCLATDLFGRTAQCTYSAPGVAGSDPRVLKALISRYPADYNKFFHPYDSTDAMLVNILAMIAVIFFAIYAASCSNAATGSAREASLAGSQCQMLQEKLEAVKCEQQDAAKQLVQLTTELEHAQASKDRAEEERLVMLSKLEHVGGDLRCREEELSAAFGLVQKLKDERSNWESDKAELESKKDELDSKKSEFENKKAALESQKAELQNQKAELESQKAELESQKAALENTLEELYCEGSTDVVSERLDELAFKHTKFANLKNRGYQFVRDLAKGSFGHIDLMRSLETGEEHVVKTVGKHAMETERGAQWDVELVIASDVMDGELSHYTLPRFYLSETVGRLMYMVMDRYRCNIFEIVQAYLDVSGTGLPEPAARYFLAQLVEGVGYLHAHGIVHRDIKPENLLVSFGGILKVVDFGSAHVEAGSHPKCKEFAGTLPFAAPEAVEGELHGKEFELLPVDWWSVGITAYDMATGENAYDGSDAETFLDAVAADAPNFTEEHGLSDELQSLIWQLAEVDPTERLGSRGAEEVKSHDFFAGLDWAMFASGDVDRAEWVAVMAVLEQA